MSNTAPFNSLNNVVKDLVESGVSEDRLTAFHEIIHEYVQHRDLLHSLFDEDCKRMLSKGWMQVCTAKGQGHK